MKTLVLSIALFTTLGIQAGLFETIVEAPKRAVEATATVVEDIVTAPEDIVKDTVEIPGKVIGAVPAEKPVKLASDTVGIQPAEKPVRLASVTVKGQVGTAVPQEKHAKAIPAASTDSHEMVVPEEVTQHKAEPTEPEIKPFEETKEIQIIKEEPAPIESMDMEEDIIETEKLVEQ
jgi:hypothetical protein